MRIKFLIAGLLGIAASSTAFAQKYEVSNAKDKYDNYLKLAKVAATYTEADKNLIEARASIDKAAANAKSAELPQTYALKAAIYSTYSMRDTNKVKTLPLFNAADEALKKAKELDTKGENKSLIADAATNLSQYQLNRGVSDFQHKQYDLAYKDFDYIHQQMPDDTTALYYSGLAAVAGTNYPAAIAAYSKLLPLKFSRKETIYLDMSSIYLTQKDTVNSLRIATEGVEKFPSSSDLRKREIEVSLQSGKAQESLSKILAAITNDPKNKTLYYYAGLTYTSFANNINDEILALKKKDGKDLKESMLPAFIAKLNPLQAKKDDFMAKAVDMFKKALEIDPNYPEVNLNMGYTLLAPAIDTYNFANNYLPPSKQKEYNTTTAKATAMAETAKPFLLKGVELNPKSSEALRNLKNYYLVTKDLPNATETQKKMDALGK